MRTRTSLFPWVVAGGIAWLGVVWIGWGLWTQQPPRAGFDLALLLDGARAVAAGRTPYDAGMLAGVAPSAADLFYSYPPVVAQAMQAVSWLPNGVVLVLWGIAATAGLGHIAAEIARRTGRGGRDATTTGAKAMLVAPLFLPFAVAVLFGNLDAFYPLAYGALLLTVVGKPSRVTLVLAGGAVALVAIAKLHPASLLVWIATRALVERAGGQRYVLAAAVATAAVVLAASLLVWGIQPWLDYLTIVRVGAGAGLVDPRNLGPISMLGQLPGLGPDALRLAQVVVSILAAAVTVLAAWRVRDPVASLAVAFAASLVVLPVTWYHYPVALIPIGLALAISRPSTRPLVAIAVAIASAALAFGPLLWAAVLLIVAAAFSARDALMTSGERAVAA